MKTIALALCLTLLAAPVSAKPKADKFLVHLAKSSHMVSRLVTMLNVRVAMMHEMLAYCSTYTKKQLKLRLKGVNMTTKGYNMLSGLQHQLIVKYVRGEVRKKDAIKKSLEYFDMLVKDHTQMVAMMKGEQKNLLKKWQQKWSARVKGLEKELSQLPAARARLSKVQ